MIVKNRSQQAFVAVTMMTVLGVTAVFLVYAVILSTIYGGNVSIVTVGASIWYNETNSTSAAAWTSTLSGIGNGSQWYSKFNVTSAGYSGYVNITWTLQSNATGSWQDVGGATAETNNFQLTGSIGQTVFASSNGLQASNKNWGQHSTEVATYRVKVVIEQA